MAQTQKNLRTKTIYGELFTPFSLAKKLDARILLESASFHAGRERYSLLLLEEAFRVFQTPSGFFMRRDSRTHPLKSSAADILDLLHYFASQHKGGAHSFPFPAGGMGYIGYEYCAGFDRIRLSKKPDPLGIPEACFIFGNLFLIFDHYTDTITLLALNYREKTIDLDGAIERTEARIRDLNFNFMVEQPRDYRVEPVEREGEREDYLRGVRKVREEIIRGNLLQGVLSRRLEIRTDMPALAAYRNLRSFNPSPYMFFLDFDDYQLFGASPEVHVKVRDGRAIMRPIAGTRRRGASPEEDVALERELLADEKERAEHLMLVDLARNDLGRICRPGSVEVTQSYIIERYSHVMHIVSQVEGNLEESKDGSDAIRATFPAGTVSGAPKIRAIETIDGLEPEVRSFYAGVVGYVEPDGSLDSCITIRSGLRKGDSLYLQAGAGIVYDSDPEREYEETNQKLRATAKSIGMEV